MCPVCGGERFESRTVAGVGIRRCLQCNLLLGTFGPRKGTNYADVDEKAYLQSIARVRLAQSAQIVELVRVHVNAGEWLDVGCGYGLMLEAARNAGFSVRGLEPNAQAAAAAHARLGCIEQGLVQENTPPADVLSTLDVIEHLDDLNAFAQLVKRKARRLWVIKVPSSEGLLFRVAHLLRVAGAVRRLWQADYEHPHVVYFDGASLTRFLQKHGFEVMAAHYLAEVPVNTVVARLTLDGAMPRWKAMLAVPVFVVFNAIERLRGKSDALLVVARPR